MNRFYHLIIFAVALCGFVMSAPPKACAQQTYYPNGLHGPSDVVSGIYPGSDRGNCCWLGPAGTLKITVPYGADTLLVTVFVPDYAAAKNAQSLRLRIGGEAVQERCCFGPGQHEFAFRLPESVAEHPLVIVRLAPRKTFVPRDIGLNGDTRHLSFLIRSIGFFDSATGQRIGAGGVPDLQSGPLIWLVMAGIAILALTLWRPIFGNVALLLTDPFLLAHALHGTTLTLPKVALVAVAIGLAARMRRVPLTGGIALALLLGAQLLFVLSMAASSWHAAGHAAALRETLKALQYAATAAVMYVAYRLDPDEGVIRTTFSIATIIVAVLALAQEFLGAPEGEMIAGHAIARIAGPLEGPNQLAGYLGVVVPAMLAFAVWRRPLVLERVAIILGCVTCVLTLSKGGIGALAVAIALLLAVRYAPARRVVAGAIGGIAFAVLFGLAFASFAGVLHGPAEQIFGSTNAADRFNGGLGARSDLWHGAYAMWRAHPFLGIGPGNFELEIGRYDPGVRTHANSMYFQVLAEQGIAGLIAMLAVIAASIGVFVRRLNEPLALGACMAGVAMAFHQVLDCMWIYPKVGVMWWLLLALGAVSATGFARLPATSQAENVP